MKTANWNARGLVQECRPFKGNNTFGERVGNAYVVYSYGTHWPLFVNVDGKWYENSDRYSVTTSKHRSQLHPLTETELLNVHDLIQLIDHIEDRIAA